MEETNLQTFVQIICQFNCSLSFENLEKLLTKIISSSSKSSTKIELVN